jgi:hypothetical protein
MNIQLFQDKVFLSAHQTYIPTQNINNHMVEITQNVILPVFETPVFIVEQARLETYAQSNNSGMFTHFGSVNFKTALYTDTVCASSFSTTSFPTLQTTSTNACKYSSK